jgi:hypothetical protein
MLKKIFIFGMILVFLSLAAAFAQNEPYVISLQGMLEGVSSSQAEIIFELYDNPAGSGKYLWQEEHIGPNAVTIDGDGIFDVLLGNLTPFGDTFVATAFSPTPIQLWMKMTVNTDPLDPLQPITAVPFAFVASTLGSNIDSIYPSALCINKTGPGVMAQSGQTYSILAVKEDDADGDHKPAIYGNNEETDPGSNPGVKGESTVGMGVHGINKDDVDDDANPAVYGLHLESNVGENPAVKGMSKAGYSIWGYKQNDTTDADEHPAVYGQNEESNGGENPGVKGESKIGYSVYGYKADDLDDENPAVYGKNDEGHAGDNPGVKGESAVGYGVVGIGSLAGGYFESSTGPALSLNGYSNNDALRIESGRINIQNKGTGVGQQQNRNYVSAGTVVVSDGVNEVTVYNGYVTNDSIILLTNQDGPNCSLKISQMIAGDSFKIRISRRHFHAGAIAVTETGAVTVAYLIIN